MLKEKNIVDSILGTLLDISGKTKDHVNARYDLKDMGIRKNLHPEDTEDSKRTKMAKACFSMTNGDKSIFCVVLKTTKLPDGSASNISRSANWMKEKCLIMKLMMLFWCCFTCFQYQLKTFFLIMWLFL